MSGSPACCGGEEGSLEPGRQAPRASGFEGQWGLIAADPQDWGKQRLHSWRAHTNSHGHRDPGQKQSFDRSLGRTYLLVSESLLGKGCSAVHWRQTLAAAIFGSLFRARSWWAGPLRGLLPRSLALDRPRPAVSGASAQTPQAKQLLGHTCRHTGCVKAREPTPASGRGPRHTAQPTDGQIFTGVSLRGGYLRERFSQVSWAQPGSRG